MLKTEIKIGSWKPGNDVTVRLCAASILLNLLLLCSCATEPSAHRSLPADVPINRDAGRGSPLIVTVQLDDGQKLPMIVDTGAGATMLDTSLKRRLGTPLGAVPMHSFLGSTTNNYYTAPKLYLGGACLRITGTEIVSWDDKKLPPVCFSRQIMGVLGIDVLENYCIQLDFAAGKMRFLDSEHADKSAWGRPFPIAPLSEDDSRPAVAGNLFGANDAHSLIDSGWVGDGWLMPNFFQSWTSDAVAPANGELRWPYGSFGGKKYPLFSLGVENFPSDGIGLDFLARHLVTLDFPNHTLYLKRQSIGPRPDPDLRLAESKPIPDGEPEVTAHLRSVVQEAMDGKARANDYTASCWQRLQSKQKELHTIKKYAGDIVSLTLVERSNVFGWRRSYRYRIEFTRASVLAHVVFHGLNKIAFVEMKTVEWKEPPVEPAAPCSLGSFTVTGAERLIERLAQAGIQCRFSQDDSAMREMMPITAVTGDYGGTAALMEIFMAPDDEAAARKILGEDNPV